MVLFKVNFRAVSLAMLRLDDLLPSPVQARSMAKIRLVFVLSLSQSHVSFPIDEFFDIAADPRDVLVRQESVDPLPMKIGSLSCHRKY